MGSQKAPSKVLFVGSVPFDSAEEVFERLASTYGDRLIALGDGETGVRINWIWWQLHVLPKEALAAMGQEYLTQNIGQTMTAVDDFSRNYMPKGLIKPLPLDHPGFILDSVRPTGYDDAAIASYKIFTKLRENGKIPKGVRYQVSIPTPLAVCASWVRRENFHQIEPLYEHRLFEAISTIVRSIPHEDLAIQLDIAAEVGELEFDRGNLTADLFKAPFDPVMPGLLDRFSRISAFIPRDVVLGLHFCYGDLNHKHYLEPQDLGLSVSFANRIIDTLKRPIGWIHMPVPKERNDEAYFASVKDLRIGDGTLVLGLVHAQDEPGTREKIAVANKMVPFDFAVSTECGLGRTPPNDVESVLKIIDSVTSV